MRRSLRKYRNCATTAVCALAAQFRYLRDFNAAETAGTARYPQFAELRRSFINCGILHSKYCGNCGNCAIPAVCATAAQFYELRDFTVSILRKLRELRDTHNCVIAALFYELLNLTFLIMRKLRDNHSLGNCFAVFYLSKTVETAQAL